MIDLNEYALACEGRRVLAEEKAKKNRCLLRKASDDDFEEKAEFEKFSDFIEFLRNDVDCGAVVVAVRDVVRYDADDKGRLAPVYREHGCPIVTIWDDEL